MWLGGCSGTLATILAGVNPEGVQRILQEWPPELPAPIQIQDYQQLGLTIAVDFAEKVGIDRLLNAVAARHFATSGRPVLVIDSGTATTVDRVSAEGVFEGGAILPGLELSGLALHHYTALLPQILPEELSPAGVAPQPLGRNTRDAIRSGLFWGQVGAVRELIRKLSSREVKPVVLVTGGAAPLLVPQLQDDFEIHSEEYLPLKGLALVGCRLGYSSQP
jgi:type III pantothenate kinase